MERRALNFFVSAGEASGDLHGASLVRAVKSRVPDARITCLGGPMLRAAGADVLVENREISVVGLFEVFRHGRSIYRAWRRIRNYLRNHPPDLLILIDFPDFNLLLAREARKLGIRVLYYIVPQLWAWRSGRAETFDRLTDEMAVILPFEPEFYAGRGIRVHYVGHPLLDVTAGAPSREAARERYGTERPGGFLVGLLPGSRHGELRRILPLLLDAAGIIAEKMPGVSFILPVAPTLNETDIRLQTEARGFPVRLATGDAYGVMRACDLILTASGTVTLEAAMLETPMIVTYKVSPWSYYAGRHLINVPWVALPNLIAGREIVPELLQERADPRSLAALALEFLENPDRLAAQRMELAGINSLLGTPGVAQRAAELALDLIERVEP